MARIQGIRVTITTLGQSKESVEGAILRLVNNETHRVLLHKEGLGLGVTDPGWDNQQTIVLPTNTGWYEVDPGGSSDADTSHSGDISLVIAKMPSEGNHFHKWSMKLQNVLCRLDDGSEHQLIDPQSEYDFQREYSEIVYDCNHIG
jgi:hypothetical protein